MAIGEDGFEWFDLMQCSRSENKVFSCVWVFNV